MTTNIEIPRWHVLVASVGRASLRGLMINVPIAVLAFTIVTMAPEDFAIYVRAIPFWPAEWAPSWLNQWTCVWLLLLSSLALDLLFLSQPVCDDTHSYACRVSLVNALARAYATQDFRGDPAKREWATAVLYNAQMDNTAGAWFMIIVGLPAIAVASLGPWWTAGSWLAGDPWVLSAALIAKFLFILIVALDIAQMALGRFSCTH